MADILPNASPASPTPEEYEAQRAQELAGRNGHHAAETINFPSRRVSPASREMPHSDEAEIFLLSTCLIEEDEGSVLRKARDAGITPDSFYHRDRSIAFSCLVAMQDAKKPIDGNVLAEELKKRSDFNPEDIFPFIVGITGKVSTTIQAGYFIDKVREHSLLREIIRTSTGNVEDAYNFTGDIDSFAADIQRRTNLVTDKRMSRGTAFTVWNPAAFRAYTPPPNLNILGAGYIRRRQLTTLIGPPGCLAFDTELTYRRGKRSGGRRITIEKLYLKFNGLMPKGNRIGRAWRMPLPVLLQSYFHDSGRVEFNPIVAVLKSGIKPCVALTLADGEVLRLTADHPVLTPDGFVAAGSLQPDDPVICRGSMRARQSVSHAPRKERIAVEGLKYYSSGSRKIVREGAKEYVYQRQHRARLVVEAGMNHLTYEAFIHALKTDPQAINFAVLPRAVDVHHLNENPLDDRPNNLEVLAKGKHTLRHNPEPQRLFNVDFTRTTTVVSVVPCGELETYDIQMADPANNFSTARGLIVHNTGKSRLSLWMGCAHIAGRSNFLSLDMSNSPAKWLFFGNENDPLRQKTDLEWFYRSMDAKEQAAVDQNLFLHVLEKPDDGIITLADPEAYAKLTATLKAIVPDVVVFDPWGNMIEGNENDNEEIRRTLKALFRAVSTCCPEAAMLVIHHARTGKSTAIEAGNNFSGGSLGRGSKALVAASRCELALWPGHSEDSSKLVLTCEKVNNVKKFEPKGLLFENGVYREDPDFSVDAWRDDIEGVRGGKTFTISDAVNLVKSGLSKTADIVQAAHDEFGCSRTTVSSRLAEAVSKEYLARTVPAGSYTLGNKPLP